MKQSPNEVVVLIGRFQPFHSGHRELIDVALKTAEHLIVVVGSALAPRQLRNPLTAVERIQIITENLRPEERERVHFVKVRDYFYNNSGWTNEVREKVNSQISRLNLKPDRIRLVGYAKDQTSHYLTWFPEWEALNVSSTTPTNATSIREAYLRNAKSVKAEPALSTATQKWLTEFSQSEHYRDLQQEQITIDDYKKSWAVAPYPPVFVTTDVLLVCCEHILLIQRKHAPGRGLWANPGGFLDGHELIFDCALRELSEETEIDLPEQELRDAFVQARVFDHPLRSSRGRTITHAHLFRLNRKQLPIVKASDDAAAVRWVPLLDIGSMESELFEDHFHIINQMLMNSPKA